MYLIILMSFLHGYDRIDEIRKKKKSEMINVTAREVCCKLNRTNVAKWKVIAAMFIYGSIGIFVRNIPLPSAVISMFRGLIGAPFLILLLMTKKSRISWNAIRNNQARLLLLGVMLGLNWIFLFEAYRYTSVAIATLCYYLAPIFIVAISPFIFKEKMTLKKVICIVVALIGMLFVSGAVQSGISAVSEIKGILLGVAAAILYAAIVVNNKKLHDISAYDRTIAQLLISAVVLLPYNLLAGNLQKVAFSPVTLILLLIVGIVHTGISYFLYFGSMQELPAQTLAILSYIDPVVAIILSAFVLREPVGMSDLIGAVLILGSAVISEYTSGKSE